jgi:hypothetical protein
MSSPSAIIKTEIEVEQGKALDSTDIGRLLAKTTKLVVMVLFQHYEEWTPFETSFTIDTHDNIFTSILKMAKKAKIVQCEDVEENKSEYNLLINGGATDATQTVCTLYNLDSALLLKFLDDHPQFERL